MERRMLTYLKNLNILEYYRISAYYIKLIFRRIIIIHVKNVHKDFLFTIIMLLRFLHFNQPNQESSYIWEIKRERYMYKEGEGEVRGGSRNGRCSGRTEYHR